MYGQINEDVAWQRVKDLQREMENSRLMAAGRRPAALDALWRLADWLGTFTWRSGARKAGRWQGANRPEMNEGRSGNRVA
jgi:hypothetical protein